MSVDAAHGITASMGGFPRQDPATAPAAHEASVPERPRCQPHNRAVAGSILVGGAAFLHQRALAHTRWPCFIGNVANSDDIHDIAYPQSSCGLVAMTSASHAEGHQFDPGQLYCAWQVAGA